jgi:hypothetical protein
MSDKPQIDPDVIAAIKKEVIKEMQSEEVRRAEEAKYRRDEQKQEHEKYVAMMKESPDPWVEIEGWTDYGSEGVKVELEWNDAFADNLRKHGITGADDDQVVQRWVALLLHDMAEQMGDIGAEDNESEFG